MHRTWHPRAALALAVMASGLALGALIALCDPECPGLDLFSR